jgi:hypothetical protein
MAVPQSNWKVIFRYKSGFEGARDFSLSFGSEDRICHEAQIDPVPSPNKDDILSAIVLKMVAGNVTYTFRTINSST